MSTSWSLTTKTSTLSLSLSHTHTQKHIQPHTHTHSGHHCIPKHQAPLTLSQLMVKASYEIHKYTVTNALPYKSSPTLHMRNHKCMHVHIITKMHSETHTRDIPLLLVFTHTCMHIHTNTHMHIHTLSLSQSHDQSIKYPEQKEIRPHMIQHELCVRRLQPLCHSTAHTSVTCISLLVLFCPLLRFTCKKYFKNSFF